jgi:23S rRNA (uridine2552-2'-O)-methyltransferase
MKRGPWEDHYTRRARKENWPARSVFKLQEIDRKYKLIRRGDHLLDLGCHPGSWSQYCLKKIGPRGSVVGVDLREPDRLSAPNFRFIQADVLRLDATWLQKEIGLCHAVISDLAPKTTGIRVADASRSLELAQSALNMALLLLKKKGHFLCKAFESEETKPFRDLISLHFGRTRIIRPAAVRKASKEIYLLGLDFLDPNADHQQQ